MEAMMKAAVYTRYGSPDVLHLCTVPRPTPGDYEVLIRVRATTVTIGDTLMRSLNLPVAGWQKLMARLFLGVFRPRRPVLGMELAGDITAVGRHVTRFKPGDAVLASTFGANFGGHAEYKCLPEDGILALKPARLTYEEAAAVPGATLTALRCLRRGQIQRGQQVLIYGASGAVGTNAVQLAKGHFGAAVTAVCSAANVDWVRALGADHVLDYTRDDFTLGSAHYDVIFDAVSKLLPVMVKKALKPDGIALNVHRHSAGRESRDDLRLICDLIEAGTLRPIIDRCYPLEQIVEAHRYVETGRKKGSVAITVAG
jgi:NADPH:quinone reductase-like Zn-dependent oxidoreductase